MRYADNESYIADCYNCALESASCFYKLGFIPMELMICKTSSW